MVIAVKQIIPILDGPKTTIFFLMVSVGQEFRKALAGQFWFGVTHAAARLTWSKDSGDCENEGPKQHGASQASLHSSQNLSAWPSGLRTAWRSQGSRAFTWQHRAPCGCSSQQGGSCLAFRELALDIT